ncbi:MAG TPA: Ig-like domain-containing protein, partial [Chthoniobacteraceae bacterium]|nr:Ig-like domain-containing protein [Chthoniobacteraceae bacterium]
PSDFKRVSVDPVTGAIQSVWDSPYHGDYALGGQPYFTADGKYILSRSGTVFSTSSTQETDLRYVTTIPYSYDMFHDAENKATFTLGPDAQNRPSVRYIDQNFLLVRTEAVTNVPGISSIFGNSSNLWLVARTDNRTTVYQHKNPALAAQLNQPPVVALSVTNGASLEGSLYRLWANPTETTDENRSTLTARWDWEADGAYDTDFIPLDYAYHAYPGPGTYTVRLQVSDEYGALSVIEKSLTIARGWFEGILAGPYPHDPFRLPFAVRLAAFHPREPWLFTVAAGRRDITVINLELGHLERTFLFDHLPAAANVECMAIRPDGSRLYAAFSEGHRYDPAGGPRRGWIAEFDLTTRTLMHEYEIPIDPADIVATDDGRFVVSEGSGAFSLLMVFDAGQRTRISANGSSQGMRLVLHPSQKFIYGADVGTSPAIMHSFELLNDGTIPLHAETTPMEGDPVKGGLHMSPDGMRVLSYGGIFFTTSTNKEFDLQLGGQLPVSGIHSAVFDTSRPMVAAAHGTNISFVSYGTNSFLLRRPVPADSIIIGPSSNRVAIIASHPNEAIISFLDFPNEDASENVGPTINLTLFDTDPVQNVGSLVNLNGVASDTDGILESVIVYNGTNVIRSGAEESFTIAEVIRPGTNILYAVATDNFNASATSMVYHVFGNHPPTVLMTAPTSTFTTYSLTTPLIVRAEAGDSDGSIAAVRLLRNGEIVATDNTAPYEFEFQPGFFGNFNVQVQAVDDLGGTATSEPQIARYVRLNDNLDSTVPVLSATNLNLTAPTFNATRQKNEPMHAGVPGGRSVWWAWRPTGGTFNYSGTVTIDTAGSDFDTVLAVYTLPPQTPLNVSNLVLVASNDDSVHPPTSRVKFTAQAFQTYYFVVDGRDGVAGNAVVTLHYVQAIRPANDNIINAARVSVFGSWKGNNKSATKEEGEPAHAGNTGGSSVWLRIDSSSSGQLQISTLSSTFDTVLAVYTNVVVTPQQTAPRMQDLRIVASNDDANDGTRTSMLTFTPRSAFTTYWIAVDGYNGAEGDIEVSVRRPLISSPPNDFFADAIPLVGSSVLRDGSNRVASTEPGEPMHISSPTTASIWYRWIAPAAGPVFISTKGSDFDTVLAVYSGTNLATLSKIAVNDDDPAVGKTSAVIFNAVANTEYRIA